MLNILLIIILILLIVTYDVENFSSDELIVYSYGNDKKKAYQLIESAKKNNITLILEGDGKKWNGFVDKLDNFNKFLEKQDNNQIVAFVDAYDVIIFDSSKNIVEKFKSFNKPIVISGEQTCYPDKDAESYYPNKHKRFRYVNSGTYIGYAGYLKKMLNKLKSNNYKCLDITKKTHENCDDQRCLTTYFIENQDICAIDYDQKIFSVLFGTNENDYDFISYNNVFNKITNNKTSIIHANASAWGIKRGRNFFMEIMKKT